ncbi:TRAP transporter small permease [Marinobacterium aestuariivivens]|uniref:TRAP transporter small permease protein n=1 Tax=Marinobacterium aestuariivivens TaxID=1698799 RepID=A0ABW1ZVV8_9GAMM
MIGHTLSRLDRGLGRLLDAMALVSSLLVVALMLFLVLSRYVFGWSVVGLLELIMLFGMWLYMVGSLIASRKGEHLVVDFLQQQLINERTRALHQTLVAVVTLAICCFFVVLSWRMLQWGMRRPQSTPGLGIPLWLPQASILFASVGCTLYALRDCCRGVVAVGESRRSLPLSDSEPKPEMR